MNGLKQQLDMELSDIIVSDKTKQEIKNKIRCSKHRNKKMNMKYLRAACVVACVLVSGTTVYAATSYLYDRIMVNKETLPELDEMLIKEVTYLEIEKKSINDDYEKKLTDYDELMAKLNLKLLKSPLADYNENMIIDYQSDNSNWINIKVTAYITGDTSDLVKVEDDDYYNYTSGVTYGSPIDLEIDVITSEEQKKTGWQRAFLGYYEYLESYTTDDGIKVNLLQDTVDSGLILSDSYKPEVKAVFVSDGIRYILSGHVSQNIMKEIVESMK